MAKGSIRKRGNRYQITVDVGKDRVTGERQRHYESFATEHEAKVALDEIIAQVENGTYMKETEESVYEFVANWLETTRRHLRPNTEYVYRRYVKLLQPFLPPIKAKDLRKKDAEEIINALLDRYKPSTVAVCRRLLSTAYNRGVEWEVIAKNPFKGIPIRQEKLEYTVWTPEQANQFIEASRDKCLHQNANWSYYIAFMIAIRAGMRKSEILGLRWSNVDIENRFIYVRESIHEMYGQGERYVGQPKSKSGKRAIWIDDILADELNRHRERLEMRAQQKGVSLPPPPNDYVIVTNDFKTIHQRNLTSAMYRIIKSENLPKIRFHDLRHTHASLLLSSGVSPKVIQERLGHARISTTMDIYSHVLPSMQKEAADKIGALLNPSADS